MRVAALLSLVAPTLALGQLNPPRMPANPDIFGDSVVFESEGDLWIGTLSSGRAERLTTWPGVESQPRFSPDGKRIGFTGTYDGNRDIYTIPVGGGEPTRWTYDPSRAEMMDWTPEGKILFRSSRDNPFNTDRLWVIDAPGKLGVPLPLSTAAYGSYSPSGESVYFTRIRERSNVWNRYRGGMQNDILKYDPVNQRVSKVYGTEYDETQPIVCNGKLYFVSDQDGGTNIYALDLKTNARTKVTTFSEFGLMQIQSDQDTLIYRFKNELYVGGKKLKMTTAGDRLHARPYDVKGIVGEFSSGPTGKRIVVASRGQLFTVPGAKGDVRPFAQELGCRTRSPQWSPDGAKIAFISDRNDEQNIWVASADGAGEPVMLTNWSKMPIVNLKWAPNSSFICATDFAGRLWKIDVATGEAKVVVTGKVDGIQSYAISPTSRLIAYSISESFNSSSVFVYDIAKDQSIRISGRPFLDGWVTFDRSGKNLFFVGGRHVTQSWDVFDFDMNANGPAARLMMVLLTPDGGNPFAEVVEEEPLPGDPPKSSNENPMLTYDLVGAPNRTIQLPIPAGNMTSLEGGKDSVFWLDGTTLKSFSLTSKKVTTVGEGVSDFQLLPKVDKLVTRQGDQLQVSDTGSLSGEKAQLTNWLVHVDPQKEWRQILREGWRAIRDTFYDPNLHGADWESVWKRAEAQLPSLGSRAELQVLIQEMQAEVNVSHMYSSPSSPRFDQPSRPGSMGLLGITYHYEDDLLKVDRVYRGDGFDDNDPSPLAAPEAQVHAGDYILSINGTPLRDGIDPQRLLMNSGRQLVKIETNRTRSLEGMRTLWVRAMTRESEAKVVNWVAMNMDYLAQNGGQDFGYVHIPAMGADGMAQFTKHFYANLDKDGLIVDVRYNGGGITSGMILERLRRVIFEYDQARYGQANPYHRMGCPGKIVVLCNEFTASDGEYFCTGFRQLKLGKVIGTRTWGGYMAVGGISTIDEGFISIPQQGSYSPNGEWLPDGTGFTPDIIVEADPFGLRDPQLDKAIEVLKAEIKASPVKRPARQTPPKKP